ncbi:MAG: tagaturonate reductase [Mucilaginibacter sp.]|nr:tagaturonate reductase [Mucilaginibacter sp.]
MLPNEEIFELPEKVLQFGTGVLLRALPDYFIDKANREGLFNGRVVVVKSTDTGSAIDFDRQDGLYTLHVKGIENGVEVNEQIVCSAISRVLSATNDWESILKTAYNPYLKVVISNTTEVGIQLVQDNITKHPPVSFPGKLLAVLYERYKAFEASDKSGLVIIPTELIVDNGKKLESIVLELAHLNQLEPAFMDWLENCNYFCNSLVDRIVPGKPDRTLNTGLEKLSGYEDNLRIVSEAYCLWAIEGNEEVRSVLSFADAHPGVIITPNIETFRELKLRLLNGTHTLTCAIAFLAGFKTVKYAMNNPAFSQFILHLMLNEIVSAIPYQIETAVAVRFAHNVLDRFKNPNLEHQWISISAQYSTKLKSRVLPLLLHHYQQNKKVPEGFAFGFAAFIRFMKVRPNENREFIGQINGKDYVVTDAQSERLYRAWESADIKTVVENILKDDSLWETDLTRLPGFKNAVIKNLAAINDIGALRILENFDLKSLMK